MEERSFIALASLAYLVSTGYALYALVSHKFHQSRLNLFVMALGFFFQTLFLYYRGEEIGHCPLTNLFETLVFIGWAIVLNYLLIGPAFRLSLLGAFTAPLALGVNAFALIIPGIDMKRALPEMGYMLETHASFSALAYGTLGLSAVAAAMFLISDHYLKAKSPGGIASRLPSLGKLDTVSFRVMLLGFGLLTVGMGTGFLVPEVRMDWVKVVWSLLVWGGYAALVCARGFSWMSPVKFSWLSVLGYLFVLLTFWGINSLTSAHQFHS